MSDTPRRRIRAQGSAGDPDVMGFVLDAAVQPGRSARRDAPGAAPLSRALFALAGVTRVEVAEATIRVRKSSDADWTTLNPPYSPEGSGRPLQPPDPGVFGRGEHRAGV